MKFFKNFKHKAPSPEKPNTDRNLNRIKTDIDEIDKLKKSVDKKDDI